MESTSVSKSEKRSKKENKKERREKRRSRDAEAKDTNTKSKGKKRSRSEDPQEKKQRKKARGDSKKAEDAQPAKEEPQQTKEVAQKQKETKKTKEVVADQKPHTPKKKVLSAADHEKIKQFHDTHNINVYGDVDSFVPLENFTDTGFPSDVLAVTKKFSSPTPIQALSWPILALGRDLIGIAETGSGKTLAFGLHGVLSIKEEKKLLDTPKLMHPRMLVVAPTRELAQQVHDVLKEVGGHCEPKVFTTTVYGGVDKGPQRRAFRSQMADIIVACPGRLLDLVNEGVADLSKVNYVVLDEADRLLDMGFEQAIRSIFAQVSKTRQTLMFSATWPKSVQKLASDFLTNPARVVIGSEDLSANSRVEQIVEVIDIEKRRQRLLELLKKYGTTSGKVKTLVFVLYKKEAGDIEVFLKRNNIPCCSIHGNKSSAQRADALESFKKGDPPVLVATDVAARGLHIPKVEYVINFSFPLTVEDYVHRIGRTGRAGATGISHTFFTKHDKNLSGELIAILRQANTPIPEALMAFGSATKKKEPKLGKIDTSFTSNRITFDSSEEEDNE